MDQTIKEDAEFAAVTLKDAKSSPVDLKVRASTSKSFLFAIVSTVCPSKSAIVVLFKSEEYAISPRVKSIAIELFAAADSSVSALFVKFA